MTTNNSNTTILKRLVSAMANKLVSEGYKVQADHIGYPNGSPNEFNKYIPDIYAEKNGKKIIINASDCVSLDSNKTRLHWNAFSTIEGIDFSIIIPASCVSRAKALAKKWDIVIKNYWSMDI